MYLHTCTCMYMYVYIHVHVCVHACTCMCMCKWVSETNPIITNSGFDNVILNLYLSWSYMSPMYGGWEGPFTLPILSLSKLGNFQNCIFLTQSFPKLCFFQNSIYDIMYKDFITVPCYSTLITLCENCNHALYTYLILRQSLTIIGHCLAIKVFIGKLPATRGVWVIIG